MFWIVIAVLLCAAILMLAASFYRTGKARTTKQLQELTTAMNAINTDEKTGTITPQEAEELRIGTGRRIV
ncbi:hypothetical protein MNBD_ALPHA06-1103, partial [hydrothermal vent metagenome]